MSETNPYAIPAGVEPPQFPGVATGELPIASQGQRFLNMIIDGILVNVTAQVVGFVVGIAYGLMAASSGREIAESEMALLQLFGGFLGLFIFVGYYIVCELAFGRTVGKFVTGTRVVNSQGQVATTGQIIGRSFARMIPFEAFSFFGGKGFPVGWHDSLSGTRVIKTR